MNEQKRILELLESLISDQSTYHLIDLLDISVNLYGLQISESKHVFLRLAKQDNSLVVWAREEYIPKMDTHGKPIDLPNDLDQSFQTIKPSLAYIPNDLSFQEFSKRLEVFLKEMITYRINSGQLKSDRNIDDLFNQVVRVIKN